MNLAQNISIDWLSFTLPFTDASMERARSLGDGYDQQELDFGRFRYNRSIRILDGANIYYNVDRREMGIHVALNASSLAVLNYRPLQLINIIIDWRGVFKRIDFAFDDQAGLLDTDVMYAKLLAGEVTTRFRSVARISNSEMGSEQKTGDTVNVGSRSSDSFIRVYDKAAEQTAKGIPLPEGVEKWVRVELELKGKKAGAVGALLGKTALSGTATAAGEISALLYGLLDFKEASDTETNKSRWDTSDWWQTFVGDVQKRKLSLPGRERSIEKSKAWVSVQCGATLAMIVLSQPDDNDQSGWDFIVQCITEGEQKMSKLQQLTLGLYNVQQKAKNKH